MINVISYMIGRNLISKSGFGFLNRNWLLGVTVALAVMVTCAPFAPVNSADSPEFITVLNSAKAGNIEDSLKLAQLYEKGEGTRINLNEAIRWLEKAADANNPEALYELGKHFDTGIGVNLNSSEANTYFKKAAALNHTAAKYRLGMNTLKGYGITANPEVGIALIMAASEKKDPDAVYALGWIYQTGQGVKIDYNRAADYYKKAIVLGNETAMVSLAALIYSGKFEGDKEISNIKEAIELYKRAAAKGNGAALDALGLLALNKGVDGPANAKQAMDYFQKALDAGNYQGAFNLAAIYWSGKSLPKDEVKAIELYQKAAQNGEVNAQSALGFIYANGGGKGSKIEPNAEIALFWLHKAALQEDANALFNLAILYGQDKLVKANLPTSLAFLKIAKKSPNGSSIENLNETTSMIEKRTNARYYTEAEVLYQIWKNNKTLPDAQLKIIPPDEKKPDAAN